jgi:decaprenylphospho-beta-D-erythro-pentofuranosid-2-ulose 2-reductase
MNYILIIGAKSDIARAIAKKYAENGYNLYLAARKSDELQNFANNIKIRNQREVVCLDFDVLDYNIHQSFYDSLSVKPIGVISVVGYLGIQEKAEINFNETKKIIDTNYTGVVSILNVVANEFQKNKSGFIAAVSSVAGDRGRRSNFVYGSAKSALTTYLSGLRNKLYDYNIRVLTIKPGFVATKMTAKLDLPKILTAQPEQVAEDIFKAHQKEKNIIYTKWFWKWIMLIIKCIPEFQFKKMDL